MLKECLASLVVQRVPADCRLDLVVVDNNRKPDARDLVADFARGAPIEIHYRHAPEPGIAIARNCAIAAALELNADWIAFIDDDEIATEDWIAHLLAAAERHGADVVEGARFRRYPEKLPRFTLPLQSRQADEGAPVDFASTHNVLFAAWIVRPHQGGLRFDERFNATGSEDVDFFLRSRDLGASMVHTRTAEIFETVPPERLRFRFQMAQQAAEAGAICLIARDKTPYAPSPARCAARAASRLVFGLAYLAASPFCLLSGRSSFERAVVRGSRRVSWAIGAARGLAGRPPTPYRRIGQS
jgi:glycosyltransferase involved in cell wall biosynthesis